ncbi:PKD domain-containing protein [Flavobacterium silvaticum]|uniref:PKD domain-containing protein n=1 Tax=Flavobacterium silvaticum TaxID=1852020 RepID=A0A972JGT6_9FLAO|nr:PKD domain-containing protein [Flavobacterium silvaticum]NMH27225.1 PKD domain-containing protein [Flavobacterium silvaticum]
MITKFTKIFGATLLLLSGASFGQKDVKPQTCFTDQLLEQQLKDNPELQSRIDYVEKQVFEKTQLQRSNRAVPDPPAPLITIPVVVYVISDPADPASNLSDDRVNSQLAALNTKFNGYGVKFCLATKAGTSNIPTPSGGTQTVPGIIHVSNAALSNHDQATEQMSLVNLAGVSVTRERYLRIWVVNTINGASNINAYATYPFSPGVFDGVVIKANVFGNAADPLCSCSSGMFATYDQGEVLVHEVGHYFGLYHTFHQGCSGTTTADCSTLGDKVCDTPPVAAPNYNCVANINTCTETPTDSADKIHNYMDYGNNDCTDSFTTGQKNRMLTMLSQNRPTLYSTDNIIYTQTCGSANLVSSTFTPSTYQPCAGAGNEVTFTSLGAAGTTYSWNFGDGATATGATASHAFAALAVPYNVTLTATNPSVGSSTTTIQIFVVNCQPITQNSHWYVSQGAGLKFSTGVPVFDPAFVNSFNCNGKMVSQCDASGNLLFYANNTRIFNASHATLAISATGDSGFEPAIACVPDPANNGKYYIFTNANVVSPDVINGLRYSIVATSGTVSVQNYKLPVTQPATGYNYNSTDGAILGVSGVAAIQNCNGYWILTTIRNGTSVYIATYSLTASGLSFVSSSPTFIDNLYTNVRFIKVAPNGNKVYVGNTYGTSSGYVFDFDKVTGKCSDSVIIPGDSSYGGSTFSPDSNLLYTAENTNRGIYQFSLNAANVGSTKKLVGTTDTFTPGNMQLGPDGKIYIALSFQMKLGVIHNPNARVSETSPNACYFSLNGPQKTSGVAISLGLPHMLDARLATAYPSASADKMSAYLVGCNQYKFFANICTGGFLWKFKNVGTNVTVTSTANTPVYTFPQSGTYEVTLQFASNPTYVLSTKTFTISAPATPQILGSNSACTTLANNSSTNNSVVLLAGQTASWAITGGAGTISGASNQSDVTVAWTTLPGTLTLTVQDASGCTVTATRTITSVCQCDCLSTIYFTNSLPFNGNTQFTIQNSNTNQVCQGYNGFVYYWTFGDGTSYYNGATTVSHAYTNSGTYSVTVQGRKLGPHDEWLCYDDYTANVVIPSFRISNVNPEMQREGMELKVYPNPTSDAFTVSLYAADNSHVMIEVLDISGRRVMSKSYDANADFIQTLDCSFLPTGIYSVRIENNGRFETQKLIIER